MEEIDQSGLARSVDDISSVADLQGAMDGGPGAPAIGVVAFWSLRGFRMDRALFSQELEALGLKGATGTTIQPSAALTIAAHDWCSVAPRKRLLWRVPTGVALLEGELEGARRVNVQQLGTVSVNADGLGLEVKGMADTPQGEATRALMQASWESAMTTAGTAEASAALVRCMKGTRRNAMLSAVPLRGDSGGVYFVPQKNVPTYLRVKALVESASDSQLVALSITAGSGLDVQGAMLAEISTEFKAIHAEMLAARLTGSEKSLTAVRGRFLMLAAKTDAWADVLGHLSQALRLQIDEATPIQATRSRRRTTPAGFVGGEPDAVGDTEEGRGAAADPVGDHGQALEPEAALAQATEEGPVASEQLSGEQPEREPRSVFAFLPGPLFAGVPQICQVCSVDRLYCMSPLDAAENGDFGKYVVEMPGAMNRLDHWANAATGPLGVGGYAVLYLKETVPESETLAVAVVVFGHDVMPDSIILHDGKTICGIPVNSSEWHPMAQASRLLRGLAV